MSTEKIENYYGKNLLNLYNNPAPEGETSEKETGEASIFYQNNTIKGEESTSAIGFYGNIIGRIIDFFDKETKDGVIDNTQQGGTGDCWLLSGINAINSTEKGKEIIKETLEYETNKNGKITGTIVHFKGSKDVYVSSDEVAKTKGSLQYSSGDDDMIIFELAVEKIMDKIANYEIVLRNDIPASIKLLPKEIKETRLSEPSIGNGGQAPLVFYLLSGKEPSGKYFQNNLETSLDEFKNNEKTLVDGEYLNKDFALSIATDEELTVNDINGKEVTLEGPHAYSVKCVTDDTVTIINPWNSSKEITLSREVILNSFPYVYSIDLSDNNKNVNYLIYTTKETVENSDGTKTEYSKDPAYGDVIYEIRYRSNGKKISSLHKTYRENRNIESEECIIYDEQENPATIKKCVYFGNGSCMYINYQEIENQTNKIEENKQFDERGNYLSGWRITTKDNEVIKTKKDTNGDRIYDTIEE